MRHTILLILMTIVSVTWAEEPIHLADEGLKAAVEHNLGVTDPTPTDMLSLTSLASVREIADLTGLEHAVNLAFLDLHGNRIADISPLSALTNLQVLVLYDNQISDLLPLSRLTNLRYLSLYSNAITDIRPLEELTNLVFLDLHRNRIVDISPVANLSKLVNLNLHINKISDISAVASLTNLEIADWHNNRITDIAPISDLSKLIHLHLGDNAISDISALSGFSDLKYLHLGNNKITDITPLSNLTNLTDLALYANNINDLSALSNLTGLKVLTLYGNNISDISALSRLTNLRQLKLGDKAQVEYPEDAAMHGKVSQVLLNGSFEQRKYGLPPRHIETLKPGRDDIVGWEIIDMPLELVSPKHAPCGQPGPDIVPQRKTVDWIGPTRWRASDGDHCLDLDGGIRQTVRTMIGESYEVRFDLAGNPELGPSTQRLCVVVDDRRHDFTFDTTGKTTDKLGWSTRHVVFTANRNQTKLAFINPTPNVRSAGVALDNVQLRRFQGELATIRNEEKNAKIKRNKDGQYFIK